MFDIASIDKNFKTDNNMPQDIVFYDSFSEPFCINGLYLKDGKNVFTRLPLSYEKREDISEGVRALMRDTTGGRIRFATSSPYIAVIVELGRIMNMYNMAPTGHSGIDVYTAKRGEKDFKYIKTFIPSVSEGTLIYTGFLEFNEWDDFIEREVILNLPLYNSVNSVKIGIKDGEKLFPPVPYKIDKPVYFYGSSITQGGCASRPGNSYMAHISRWLDCDFCNLGFSGNAKGEKEIAEFIASNDMSAFVLDYDANAPSVEHLEETHYPFYKIVRDKHPDIPIVIVSYPRFDKRPPFLSVLRDTYTKDQRVCNYIIRKTYLKAIEEGDRNVYYIDGSTLFGTDEYDSCTVDSCHPNDLGFYKMAKTIYPILKKALFK